MSIEKICLNWNKFEENIITSFRSLREDLDLCDVSLVCADGLKVEAHKIVLAASSSFFINLFKGCKPHQTLIYMRGVSSKDLVAILDFVYFGEANIHQDNVEAFLRFAKELELKGLEEDSNIFKSSSQKSFDKSASSFKKEPDASTETTIKPSIEDISKYPEEVLVTEMTVVVPNQTPTVNFKEMDEKIKAMMSRGQTMRKDGQHKNTLCIICGKEGQYINIRDHIEARHMDSISLPCNFCERTFRTRCTLRKHMVGHKDKTMNYIRLFKDFDFDISNEISKPVQD